MKQIGKFILFITCFLFTVQEMQAHPLTDVNNSKIVVDSDYLVEWVNNNPDLKEIRDKKKYDLQNFTSLKDGQDQFSYYILNEVNLIERYKSYLIYEYSESESYIYLVNYDKNGSYIDSLVVFYDNAEGAWQTSSTIDSSKKNILIKEYNAYSDPEDHEYMISISYNGKFKKEQENEK